MYSHILAATDGSDLASRGLAHAVALAKALNAQLTVLTVSEPWVPIGVDAASIAVTEYGLSEEYERAEATAGQQILDDARAAAAKAGVTADTLYIARKYPAEAIIDTAESRGVDLIVMASHGRRAVQRMLLGSQTAEVVNRSHVPVLVVR